MKPIDFKDAVIGKSYVVMDLKGDVGNFTECIKIERNLMGDRANVVSLTRPGIVTPIRRANHVYGEFLKDYALLELTPIEQHHYAHSHHSN